MYIATIASTESITTTAIGVNTTYAMAMSQLTTFMRGLVNKKSKNKRALSRVQTLIVRAKTEITHNKREAILFDLLEELEEEIARL